MDAFVVAVASGKGGTGKTAIAVNLALTVCGLGHKVQYLDCDVEEPNGHIFIKPKITGSREITVDVPQVDPEKCAACGKCGEICQYGAIICVKEQVLTFEQLCHSCGGCRRICPVCAVGARPLKIGDIELGKVGEINFVGGELQIGHVRTPAMIKEVKKYIRRDRLVIIDVPAGTSCPVVEAVKGVGFVLLVTEPTPFGLNDLKLAVGLVREMSLDFAVVINRCDISDGRVEKYCEAENIDVGMKLPDERRIAELYSSREIMTERLPKYKDYFTALAKPIESRR